jgi:hypothetical protein
MKTIPLYHVAWYLTTIDGITWRDQDYRTHAMVKIVKREPFNSTLVVNRRGVRLTFTQKNGRDFLPVLYEHVADNLQKHLAFPFTLVPIPNSEATIAENASFPTLELAQGITAALRRGVAAVPALRWARAKPKAHKGGLRDIQAHYDLFRIVQKPQEPVVLFDDVKTTGSQLIAAYRKLSDAGVAPIAACVIGHASREQHAHMSTWTETELEVEEEEPFDW